jgi:predicted AAA+ superfamily ATPase
MKNRPLCAYFHRRNLLTEIKILPIFLSMEYIERTQESRIRHVLARGKSVLLLGPRQTGKTTLIARLHSRRTLSFMRPDIRQRYEKAPGLLIGEMEALKTPAGSPRPLVVLDEVQKVPHILDAVQDLIDRKIAQFVLTGSSARKLRRGSTVNLLPGRVVALRLDPLTIGEMPTRALEDWLLYGGLPEIVQTPEPDDRDSDLGTYVTTYLEEEVRAEAVVRNLGAFARFVELAAGESGRIINMQKLSQEVGVSHTAIRSYFQILEDCLLADRIDPVTAGRHRARLTKAPKFLFFDLGVRRVAAREGTLLPRETLGALFEQLIGLELLRGSRVTPDPVRIKFWRSHDGPEVDWVVERSHHYIPVEVKWTDAPSVRDIRHLQEFLREYPSAREAYLVCRASYRLKLDDHIQAIPWQEVGSIL